MIDITFLGTSCMQPTKNRNHSGFLLQYKEENILYPAIDQFISDEERQNVFGKMDALPEHKYKTCCHQKID